MPSPITRKATGRVKGAALVVAVAGASALSGCSSFSPQTTATPYAASDGVLADIGDVGFRNIMLISGARNASGQLYGTVVNHGTSATRVTFTSDLGAMPAVNVNAGEIVNLGKANLVLAKVPVVAGRTVTLNVGIDGVSKQLSVPVLDGTLPEYKTLATSSATAAG